MITNNDTYEGINYTKFELSGLSTDAKPTVTFDGKKIVELHILGVHLKEC